MTPRRWLGLLVLMMCEGALVFAAAGDGLIYTRDQRRDPFVPLLGPGAKRPSSRTSAARGSLMLEGVAWDSGGRSLALINGVTYQEGDETAQFKVLKISKDAVKLIVQGDEVWLTLTSGRESTRPAPDAEKEDGHESMGP